jgi:hypothetical protein
MAGARLVFDVDVCAGNEHSSKHCAPGLWTLLDRIPRDQWPVLLRGDAGFGNDPIMREAEQRGVAYLFKLRLTSNVKRMIAKLSTQSAWINAGQGFEAKESTVRLEGWSRQRRAIVLRRRVKGTLAASVTDEHGQRKLSFVEVGAEAEVYEYSVLVTSLDGVVAESVAKARRRYRVCEYQGRSKRSRLHGYCPRDERTSHRDRHRHPDFPAPLIQIAAPHTSMKR